MIDQAKVERLRHLTKTIYQSQTELESLWSDLKQDAGEYIRAWSCNPYTCVGHKRCARFEIGTQRHGYMRYGSWDWDLRPPRRQEYRHIDLYNADPPRTMEIRHGAIIRHSGIYELVASQPVNTQTEHVFVKVGEAYDFTEREHQLAVQAARQRAARQGMRLRVRDRVITLIAPTNTEILTGGVFEVAAWLLGISLDAVAA